MPVRVRFMANGESFWEGTERVFVKWQQELAASAGVPLQLMEGWYRPSETVLGILKAAGLALEPVLPIRWSLLAPRPVYALLAAQPTAEWSATDLRALVGDLRTLLPSGDDTDWSTDDSSKHGVTLIVLQRLEQAVQQGKVVRLERDNS